MQPLTRLLIAVALAVTGLAIPAVASGLSSDTDGATPLVESSSTAPLLDTSSTAPASTPVTMATPRPTRPAVADTPIAPPALRPTRGAAEQVTPTLPPPTTTTTLPPIDEVPPFSGEGRRVVYSIGRQRVWAVESNGKLAKTHAVSGRLGQPSPGTYAVFSRSLYTNSIKNPSIKWMYMVRFTKGPSGDNIGFHEIPTECDSSGRCWKLQSESQLGQPLSGGCVRQATADAIWMWNWAQLGTKVVVVP